MTGWGFWTWKPLGAWGSECGATWNSSPFAATRAAYLTGGGGDYTTEGGGGAHGPGGRPAPEPQVPPGGARAVPQICTDVRSREVGSDRWNDAWSPANVLLDTVARMQQDLADLRAENRLLRTPGVPPVVRTPRQAAFTTTTVPRFGGTTSWEQYRQVCDAIVLSNGWDDETAALQLFSHLEGDALNVAFLVPMSRRLTRTGLVDALSAHYG